MARDILGREINRLDVVSIAPSNDDKHLLGVVRSASKYTSEIEIAWINTRRLETFTKRAKKIREKPLLELAKYPTRKTTMSNSRALILKKYDNGR